MDIIGGTSAPADLVKETNQNGINIPLEAFGYMFFIIIVVFCFALAIFLDRKAKKQKNKQTNNSKCPICGEPSETHSGEPRQDKLCPCHAAMLRDDQIALCKYCGSWYNTNETCKCRKLD